MAAARQLSLDGSEVVHPPQIRVKARLTNTQRRILRIVRRRGYIRSVEAGNVAHAERGHCAFGTKSSYWPMRGIACCPYAGSDGLSVCKRMMENGLLIRGPRKGTWIERPTADENERGQST